MRHWIIVILCIVPVGNVGAQDDPTCQGGDGVWDATVIESLPYFTQGTTRDYADDYDAWCIGGEELAPDVVYVYTPTADGAITIDTCGSGYNTTLYVFDANAAHLACNDNRNDGDPCWVATARIDRLDVTAFVSYFIVVDGGTINNDGQYDLVITEHAPYEFAPPWYAEPENEPPLVDGYVDTFNGGCDADDPEFQYHPFDTAFGYNASLHGRSGWYADTDSLTVRDSDWFLISDTQGELNLTIEATEPCQVSWYEVGSTCADPILGGTMFGVPGYVREMVIYGPYASSIRVKVTPGYYAPPDGEHHEFEYLLGVRWDDGWERPYPTPLGDECLDASVISHSRNGISAPIDDFVDDHAPHSVCVDSADVYNDGLVQIYLYEDQRVHVGAGDIWLPEPARGDHRIPEICFYLVTDARLTPGSCVDAVCGEYSQWGFTHTFTAPQSAWYYMICDFDNFDGQYSLGANITFPEESPYAPPPPPPLGDNCATAPLIGPGPGPFAFAGDLDHATNQLDPGRDGCLDDPGVHWTGGDMVYRVDLRAGDRLTADLVPDGDWDAALYLVSDCEEPMGTCLVSGLNLEHVALEDQTLWLVCDSWGIGPRPYTLSGSLDSTTAAPATAAQAGVTSIQPNPCNPSTTVEYALSRPGPVTLAVYDLRGRLVRTLVQADRPAGSHHERWHGDDAQGRHVASGVYVLRLQAPGLTQTRSLAVLR